MRVRQVWEDVGLGDVALVIGGPLVNGRCLTWTMLMLSGPRVGKVIRWHETSGFPWEEAQLVARLA